ncbi:hypothetical protein ABWK42_08630 [Bacillus sp. JJ927]
MCSYECTNCPDCTSTVLITNFT